MQGPDDLLLVALAVKVTTRQAVATLGIAGTGQRQRMVTIQVGNLAILVVHHLTLVVTAPVKVRVVNTPWVRGFNLHINPTNGIHRIRYYLVV